MSSRNQSPTSALIAHVEHLVAGSRVLVVGSAQNLVPAHLLGRGARLVQILDPDPKVVALAAAHNTERRVSYAQLTETSLRDAAFDCAIVEDLGAAEDPERLLLGIRRSIGPRGIALIASSTSEKTSGLLGVSAGSIGYGELVEMAGLVFEDVMMLGQAPFVGYSVVSLALDAPPEPCLDNEFLIESESADRYIALCGTEDALSEIDLEDMTIVQLPAGPVLEDGESLHRERERRAQRRIDALESELLKLRRRDSPSEVEALTRQLEERDSWIRDLEARAAGAEARVDDLEAEQERLEGALADSQKAAPTGELQTLQEELDSVRRSAARSQKETRWAEERVRKLERELEAALSEIEEAEETNLSLELSERVSELEAENRALSAKLKRAVQAAEPYERELSETEQELEETHESLLAVTEELARAKKELGRSRKELEEKNAQPSQGPHKARDGAPRDGAREKLSSPELDADLQRLEEQLIERAAKIQELEEQLRKLEIFSKTLTVELSQSHGKGQVEQLEGELDRISQSLAEREADLVAAEWTIGELKQRLSARTG